MSSAAMAAVAHIYLTWKFLSPDIKKDMDFFVKDVCAYKGVLIARLFRQRKLVADDFRDSQFEAEFSQEVENTHFDPSK
ncbi:hypothetical protein J3B02_003456, partial [Coemansia erecta]